MLKTSKKVLSIVLALVLVFSSMALSAFAAFDPSTQTLGLVLVPDKDLTKLNVGDTVTFTLYCDVADFDQLFGAYKLPVFFDPNVYAPEAAYTLYNEFADYYKDASTTTIVSTATAVQKIKDASTNLAAEHTQFVNFLGAADTGKGVTAAGGFHMALDDTIDGNTTRTKAQMSFNMEVIGTAGNTDVVIADGWSNASGQYFKTTTGSKATNLTAAAVNTEFANAMANNPSASGPVVAKSKGQIKMTPTSATTVADEFQFRVISVITDADWDTYFSNTESHSTATTDVITEVGMVAYAGAGTMDMATAESVANGTEVADYKAASTDYISKTGDGDATFGAIQIFNTPMDVQYVGYVKYLDNTGAAQIIFYEAVETAALATNYDALVSSYLAAYPYAG